MGKTAKFLRSLLGSKKSPPSSAAAPPPDKEKKKSKWALLKSADYNKFNNEDPLMSPYGDVLDANKHAIAVAAATAAVAEAALAAAQAAAEVVRLTIGAGGASGSGRNVPAYDRRRVAAAVMIQSAFRAYLARRALRALKGLVKLQALVRGHIVRKQSADMLRRMQAMARIQARASATRSYIPEYPPKTNIKFSNYLPSGVVNHRNYHQWSDNTKKPLASSNLNWLNHWMEQYSWNNSSHGDDDKILEIDTWKPHQTTKQRADRAFPSRQRKETGLQKPNPSISSEEVSSSEVAALWTAESSPRLHSASSRPTTIARGVFTPTRSECSRSLLGDFLSHPSYMANTESSRAKVRSLSAPKQRMQLEELGVSSSYGQNAWESDAMSEKGYGVKRGYGSNVYLRSSQVKRLGAQTRGGGGSNNGVKSSFGYRF